MSGSFAAETARAWGIPVVEVKDMHYWVGQNVGKDARSAVFASLLRRKRSEVKAAHLNIREKLQRSL